MHIDKIAPGVNAPHDIDVVINLPGWGDKIEAILMGSIERANKD